MLHSDSVGSRDPRGSVFDFTVESSVSVQQPLLYHIRPQLLTSLSRVFPPRRFSRLELILKALRIIGSYARDESEGQ